MRVDEYVYITLMSLLSGESNRQGNWLLKEPKDGQVSYARIVSPTSSAKSPKLCAGSGAGGSPLRRQRVPGRDMSRSPTSGRLFLGRYRLGGLSMNFI